MQEFNFQAIKIGQMEKRALHLLVESFNKCACAARSQLPFLPQTLQPSLKKRNILPTHELPKSAFRWESFLRKTLTNTRKDLNES